MPGKGTPLRTIRVPDDEWRAAASAATAIGSDISTEVRAALHNLANRDHAQQPTSRRIKEIRMPTSTPTIRCTWENPCATCAEVNTERGITEPSVTHNPWLLVSARDVVESDTVRDFGDGEHVRGRVVAKTKAGVDVHWSDGEDARYPVTGRAVKLLRALRDGELTFRQEMAATR